MRLEGSLCSCIVYILQDEKPMAVLHSFIFNYVETLLGMREDYFVREACNILKVCYYLC